MDTNDIPIIQAKRQAILKWLNDPITKLVQVDNDEQKEKLTKFVCEGEFEDVKAYFTAVGHLRGLRRGFGIVQDELDELDEQLKGI